ncbi:Bug family tripartite tricarboxylate transporter substrate binding protein [Variovorax boronicumulans]
MTFPSTSWRAAGRLLHATRRGVLRMLPFALVLAVAGMAPLAQAQDAYPSKAVTLIVGFPPGTATDTVARLVAERLSTRLGQPFIIDNRPGVGGSLGAGVAAKARPDGYTLLVSASAPMSINPHIYAKLAYDPLKDFTAIGMHTWLPFMLVARPELPAANLTELIALAKKSPGSVTYASTGSGTTSHLIMAVLGAREQLQMRHVPYKGSSQAQADLIGGLVDVSFDTQVSSLSLVKAGRLKALAVSTVKRAEAQPKVPTVAEQGLPGFDMGAWLGLFAPAGLPPDIRDKLSTALRQVLKEPDFVVRIRQTGAEVRSSESPADFAEFVKKDNEEWGKIVRAFNVKAE